MLRLEPELRERGAPERLIALDRREVFSVYPELRLLAWGGVMLIAAGAAILVRKNLDPKGLAALMAVAAAVCYGYAGWRKAASRHSLIDDYVLLLGALLVSADVAYVETQFHLLGEHWSAHFLIVAVLHAVAAYGFASRTVLSLAIAALAAWFGVERRNVFDFVDVDTAQRALVCAAVVLVWRFIDARAWKSAFTRTFEHFAANLALFGALSLTFHSATRVPGALLTIVLASVVVVHGYRQRAETFVLYAYCYAVVAVDVLVIAELLPDEILAALFLMGSSIAAIVGLFILHGRFRRR